MSGENGVAARIEQPRRGPCLQIADPLAFHEDLPVNRDQPSFLKGDAQVLPTEGGHEFGPPVRAMQSTWEFVHGSTVRPAAVGR